MSQQDAFDRILPSLFEAMLDDDHWIRTSALIDEACGSRGNLLVFGDGRVEDDDANIFFARFCYRGERHLEWEHEYFSVFHPVDERIPRLRCLPDSELVHVTDLYTEEELKTSPTYNDALLRSQHQNSLNTRLDGPGGSRIVLAIADPVKDAGWSSAQINMIRRLLPHLRQFVRVRQALTESAALGASLAELLENARFGVIQVDRRAQIVGCERSCARVPSRRHRALRRGGRALRHVAEGGLQAPKASRPRAPGFRRSRRERLNGGETLIGPAGDGAARRPRGRPGNRVPNLTRRGPCPCH